MVGAFDELLADIESAEESLASCGVNRVGGWSTSISAEMRASIVIYDRIFEETDERLSWDDVLAFSLFSQDTAYPEVLDVVHSFASHNLASAAMEIKEHIAEHATGRAFTG